MTDARTKQVKKTCINGHVFYKSSNCPACPICAQKHTPVSGLLSVVNAPARRALERADILTITQLSAYTEKEILSMHGIGPSSIPKLRKVLADEGLSFKS